MAQRSVFCISDSEAQASEIINQLRMAGFSNDDVSALLPDRTGTRDFAHERHSKAPEGAATGGLIGGILGASLGWLAGIGVLAAPEFKGFVAAGPVIASLGGTGLGMLVGGLLGAMFGLARPEYEARRYQGKINQGNILISVHCADGRTARLARSILRHSGARDIAVSGEATAMPGERGYTQVLGGPV
jgi:hypothetical protein